MVQGHPTLLPFCDDAALDECRNGDALPELSLEAFRKNYEPEVFHCKIHHEDMIHVFLRVPEGYIYVCKAGSLGVQ